jgi:hypothetical protein
MSERPHAANDNNPQISPEEKARRHNARMQRLRTIQKRAWSEIEEIRSREMNLIEDGIRIRLLLVKITLIGILIEIRQRGE